MLILYHSKDIEETSVIFISKSELKRSGFGNGSTEHFSFTREQAERLKINYFMGSYFFKEKPIEGSELNRMLRSQHDSVVSRLVMDQQQYAYSSLFMVAHGFNLPAISTLYVQFKNKPAQLNESDTYPIIGYFLLAEAGAVIAALISRSKQKHVVDRFNKFFLP